MDHANIAKLARETADLRDLIAESEQDLSGETDDDLQSLIWHQKRMIGEATFLINVAEAHLTLRAITRAVLPPPSTEPQP